MPLTLSPVTSIVFILAIPVLTQSPIVLDPVRVPCNWRGDADGDWLYMSTSTMPLNRTLVTSSNFINQGGVYEDGITCDPALFFLSPHRTNVSLWNGTSLLTVDIGIFLALPRDLTMLNLTFSRRLAFLKPLLESAFLLKGFPRLQSLCLLSAPFVPLLRVWRPQIYSGLLILDLSYNNIYRLGRRMFHNMHNLTVIILNGNRIHSIFPNIFCGHSLPMLHSVSLINALTNIPDGIIPTPYLISGGSFFTPKRDYALTNIQDRIFSTLERYCNTGHLTYLTVFRLSRVQFLGVLKPFGFSKLRGVSELQVSGAGVRRIEGYAFACLAELRNLFLSDNRIQNISLQAFRHLSSLQQLLLNNNSLNSMQGLTFQWNHRLVYLNASHNMIESLAGHFSPRILDFSHNRIARISNYIFIHSVLLEELYLQYNSLDKIEFLVPKTHSKFPHRFGLRNLRILNLAHNRLTHVSEYPLDEMSSLSELYLNDNLIRHIEANAFLSVERLQILNLANNSLSIMSKDLFANMTLLRELSLNDNLIRHIEDGAFLTVNRLQILNLSHNLLSNISGELFGDMYVLRELYLNGNLINHIEDGAFLSVKRLQVLNLAHNRLSNISENLFADMSAKLYLNDNLLRHIESEIVLFHFTLLSGVTLAGNPWNCNCELDPLRSWLKEYGNITLDLQQVTCFQTRGIIAFHDHTFCEEEIIITNHILINNTILQHGREDQNNPYPLLPMVGVLIGLLCLLVVGGITVFKFWSDIQVLIFAKYGIRLPWKRFTDAEDQNRAYDAFVSYNSSDEGFVLRELMPRLERHPPFYKLCLHFRDFALGAAVAENIVEAIDTSKRTIMLVSKDFLQSDWCQYEFQMAHHQVLSEGGRNRLILIMMERIDVSDIADRTLKSYIRTHTYIDRNDPRFWERLRFALPDKKDTSDRSRPKEDTAESSKMSPLLHAASD